MNPVLDGGDPARPDDVIGVQQPAALAAFCVVLDTNIVLDLLLFQPPETVPLRAALHRGELCWLATERMREELLRVLAYPQIAQRAQFHGFTFNGVLQRRDRWARAVEAAPRCQYVCKDADDQCFVDLAAAHGALLLSKDAQVLKLRKRLARLGVVVSRSYPPAVSDLAALPVARTLSAISV